MARATWLDKAPDVAAVVAHLEAAAKAAKGPLAFEPVQVPGGTDLAVLHQAALLRVRAQLSISHAEADRILAQEVRAIDDLVRTANLLVERLREWYALHAPEAARMVPDAEELTRLVVEHGERGLVMTALNQAQTASTSLGTDLDARDMAVLQGFAAALQAVHESWRALEVRVGSLMEEVAPNVASVVGPVIGARLIAISGGLNRLATWPAGTVQLLGAETALFRHLKEGTKPPKHGILFQHPLVHSAVPWNRGVIARALALAAATGAKADAFTKNDLRVFLKAQLDKDLARIATRKPSTKQRTFTPGRRPYGRAPPSRDGPRPGGFAPRDSGPRYGPPRDGPRPGGFGPREGARDAPRDAPRPGAFGSREGARDDRGPRREGGWSPPPRRDGPGGPPRGPAGGAGAGKPWKRKPQGAFRRENKPAAPPGRGDKGDSR
ncbi:MAG: NOP5/NOP56 family protein [bacterium]